MRMFAQDRAFYRRVRVDGTDDEEARAAWIVEGIEEMRERFPAEAACRTFGVSRATYCEWRRRLKEGGVAGLVPRSSRPLRHAGRQWTMADAERVLGVRRAMPWAGKARVAVELASGTRGGRCRRPPWGASWPGAWLPGGCGPARSARGAPGHGCLTSSCLEGR